MTEADQLIGLQKRADTIKIEVARKEQELAGLDAQLEEARNQLNALGVDSVELLSEEITRLASELTTARTGIETTLQTAEASLGITPR